MHSASSVIRSKNTKRTQYSRRGGYLIPPLLFLIWGRTHDQKSTNRTSSYPQHQMFSQWLCNVSFSIRWEIVSLPSLPFSWRSQNFSHMLPSGTTHDILIEAKARCQILTSTNFGQAVVVFHLLDHDNNQKILTGARQTKLPMDLDIQRNSIHVRLWTYCTIKHKRRRKLEVWVGGCERILRMGLPGTHYKIIQKESCENTKQPRAILIINILQLKPT